MPGVELPCHAGIFLTGIALLTPLGLTGAAVYMIGHALVKAALFLCTGIVLHRLGSVNESWLHGHGRPLRVTGIVFTVAAFGLADLPPSTTFLGKGWIEDSGSSLGAVWITVIFVLSSVLVGGAVLRVAGGVFYGLGDPPAEDPQMALGANEETSETDRGKRRTPLTMIIPADLLAAAACVAGLLPDVGRTVEAAVVRFQDQARYNLAVLSGVRVTHPVALSPVQAAHVTVASVATAVGAVWGSLLLALLALYWRRLPVLRSLVRPDDGLVRMSRSLQSGVINDYVTWIVVGLACVGGTLAVAIR